MRLLQPPPAEACPVAALSWALRGEGAAEPLAISPAAVLRLRAARSPPPHQDMLQWVGRRGQGGWVLSCSLLVAGSDPVDGGATMGSGSSRFISAALPVVPREGEGGGPVARGCPA